MAFLNLVIQLSLTLLFLSFEIIQFYILILRYKDFTALLSLRLAWSISHPLQLKDWLDSFYLGTVLHLFSSCITAIPLVTMVKPDVDRKLVVLQKWKVLKSLELWEHFRESVPFEEMQIESILYVAFRIKFSIIFEPVFEPFPSRLFEQFCSCLFTSLFNLINHEHFFTFHKYSFDCHIFVTFSIPKSQENANFREIRKKSENLRL